MPRMKTRIEPATTPGNASGSVTRRNVRAGPAPRPSAASSSVASMPSRTLCNVSTMKGRLTAVMPTITAVGVYMISSGAVSRPRK